MTPEKRAEYEERVAIMVDGGVPLDEAEGLAVWDVGVELVRRPDRRARKPPKREGMT